MARPKDYIDVAQRIVEFREKFPNGSLRQLDLKFIDFAGKSWVVYTAAAYRSPDDTIPGIGTAWEPVPGPTSFTRDSEVQNAETSAWGRAMIAALAVDSKDGIASLNEIQARQIPEAKIGPDWLDIASACETPADLRQLWADARNGGASQEILDKIEKLANG
jgi:hypothetical protein